jgi:5-deoxy-glucuronate isomerase
MTTDRSWFHHRGALARGQWESVVDGDLPGWSYTGLRIADLSEGESIALPAVDEERIVVPLAGTFAVEYTDARGVSTHTQLLGRDSVFDGPTDVVYLPPRTAVRIEGHGRVAVASAPATAGAPARHVWAAEVPVELRGAGAASREVRNFGTPGVLEASRLIVCEVITPAGNWSSYPPHKHDEHIPGKESRLEEIYYFEAEPARDAGVEGVADSAFGLFHTSSSPAGEIAIDAQVRSGDIALVPFGYHGPAVAAPGYNLYYLNVMAGPDAERVWLTTDDPAHAWVRTTWDDLAIDERLPLHSRKETVR